MFFTPYVGLMMAPLKFFLRMVSMALVLLGVGTILGNGYGIQGQNYVALLLEVKCQQGFTTEIWY